MKLLRVPAKHNRSGIKIKCLKCKYQVSETCKLKGTKLVSCDHKERHRFNLVVHVPNTINTRKMKLLQTKDFNTALDELIKFKAELKNNNYHKVVKVEPKESTTTFIAFSKAYLDAISGINTHKHLIRKRSRHYITETKLAIERFVMVLKRKGYTINMLELNQIGDDEVEFYHEYLIEELKLSIVTYNKHFVILKAFFNWVIKTKHYNVINPFTHAELTFIKRDTTIITREEYIGLMDATTYDNGWGYHSGQKRNLFKNWLPFAFRLGLETGGRAEEIISLRWCDLMEIEKGVPVFGISNLKVNRIKFGYDTGKYIRYIPVTKSLKKLLNDLGFAEKQGSDRYLLDREDGMTDDYMMKTMSRGFTHFIKKVTDRKIQFKDLRKTYITRLTLQVGDKAKLFTGHSNDAVLKNHYLSSAHLAGRLNDFEVF